MIHYRTRRNVSENYPSGHEDWIQTEIIDKVVELSSLTYDRLTGTRDFDIRMINSHRTRVGDALIDIFIIETKEFTAREVDDLNTHFDGHGFDSNERLTIAEWDARHPPIE